MKDWLIKQCARLLPTPEKGDPKRFLIVSTTGLGDTLWATPAIASLKESVAGAFVAVLTSPIGQEALQGNPSIDQIHVLQEPLLSRFVRLRRALVRGGYGTVLVFHASQRLTCPLVATIGASQIIGVHGHQKGQEPFLTHELADVPRHEIARRLAIVKAAGGQALHHELAYYGKGRPFLPAGDWIALHPGSKDGFKRWPQGHFIALGKRLQRALGCDIAITGGPGEERLMHEIASAIDGAIVVPSHLSLADFAATLRQTRLFVCNDTGPMHLACAIQHPVVGLYAATDPTLCGPYQAKSALLVQGRPSCTPCLRKKCRMPFCMMQIGVDEVFKKIVEWNRCKHSAAETSSRS
ncbi:MAG: hypothetical protein RL235_684 [Chlamydiota bacterium]|jgi:ADP-heptose:LPS heptosyltransferase